MKKTIENDVWNACDVLLMSVNLDNLSILNINLYY